MNTYLREFAEKYGYPKEAVETLLSSYDVLKCDMDFVSIVHSFYDACDVTIEKLSDVLSEISIRNAINLYTVQLTFFVCITPCLKTEYEKQVISETVYSDTVNDLLYKLIECHNVENVWGIIPLDWFYNVFHMKVFALGRLEYGIGKFNESAMVAGRTVNAGDDVIYIHIPSSGKPFDRVSRLSSYDRAYHFFKDHFGIDEPVFCCSSWLLFPQNKEILGENSNIVSFMDDFKIISSSEYPDNRNMWRIFGSGAELPPSKLPDSTSLQRAFANWIQSGHRLGGGVGLFIYDPINKTTLL